MPKKITLFASLSLLAALAACQNQEWVFPDYAYQATYFAYQSPVRTITLGEDIFDTSLDNEHKCKIMATTGGVYDNKNDVVIDIDLDNSLVAGLQFKEDGSAIRAMPATHFELLSDQIVIPKGEMTGGVEVQLTDAFFADPLALKNTYVIPLRMSDVTNADSILSGTPLVAEPRRGVTADWSVQPKDYILYAVKYVNPWHGFYLRRGQDLIEREGGETNTVVRHAAYVEYDEVNALVTQGLNEVSFPLVFKDAEGYNVDCTLTLTFEGDGNCTVSSAVENVTATGRGTFVKRGEKNSWGEKDRDALYLSYEIEAGALYVTATDTLVLRDRGVAFETFTPIAE
ncbi:protein of unknown function [Catalinimonas alkaloidigena]|uniref:DUF1735 domain-containing protein n=1 Tax=Catalinimonas alkaloidigena TaxID=1075417 RepID=A0A1G9HMG4_9BACT|nr:DUF5627 domain-containing protein [Catalinimonas alkaloidigena]SDL13703.1 protein of unknown function [Catalinimonas alkaloidigena]